MLNSHRFLSCFSNELDWSPITSSGGVGTDCVSLPCKSGGGIHFPSPASSKTCRRLFLFSIFHTHVHKKATERIQANKKKRENYEVESVCYWIFCPKNISLGQILIFGTNTFQVLFSKAARKRQLV